MSRNGLILRNRYTNLLWRKTPFRTRYWLILKDRRLVNKKCISQLGGISEISAKPSFKLLPQTVTDFKVDEHNGVLKTNTELLKYGTYRMTG